MKPEEFNLVKHRKSDEAEHIVFQAISQLILEGFQAPFIAIHGFNVDGKKHKLKEFFPSLQWTALRAALEECFSDQMARFCPCLDAHKRQELTAEFSRNLFAILGKGVLEVEPLLDELFGTGANIFQQTAHAEIDISKIRKALGKCFNNQFREYDFVLMGPKIGIIVIEVKHSPFTQTKHFKHGKSFLPDDIVHGIEQLSSFGTVFDLLKEPLGTDIPIGLIRKVLFVPNLEKQRFCTWYDSLNEHSKPFVDRQTDLVDAFWFAEDMNNTVLDRRRYKSPLYSSLRGLLHDRSLRFDAYKVYCPLIAGLASATIFKTSCSVEIPQHKLSEAHALLDVRRRIETQDPSDRRLHASSEGAPVSKQRKRENNADFTTVTLTKTIILTPEQKGALEGPAWQFILGPAGTGKTISLQAKAMKLLEACKRVLVLAPACYAPQYKTLFDGNGFTNYVVEWSWRSVWNQHGSVDDSSKFSAGMLAAIVRILGAWVLHWVLHQCK